MGWGIIPVTRETVFDSHGYYSPMNEKIVSIIQSTDTHYPQPPFHPSGIYEEFSSFVVFPMSTDSSNHVYDSVRETLIRLELDKEHIGTEKWNPFRGMVSSGNRVVIKPNLVRHTHPYGDEGVLSMITHASVLRPIIDYILLAVGRDVKITICDVPLQQTVWDEMIRKNGLKELMDFYNENGVDIELLDLRLEISKTNKEGIIYSRERKIRDPLGYSPVDLGKKSALMPIIEHYERFEITDYGTGTVPKHHNPEKNEYFIPNTILHADLFINVPKLKTHKKTGITFALKNLIGINGDKSWLAHHRRGDMNAGGDEYRKLEIIPWIKSRLWAFLKRFSLGIAIAKLLKMLYVFYFPKKSNARLNITAIRKAPIVEGSWYGNDTVWRCIKDLNNIVLFADKNGTMQNTPQRKYLCIGDGIIAGDKEGPMRQRPRPVGMIIGGMSAVAVDRVAAHVLGFDFRKIPQIREGFESEHWSLTPFKESEIIWNSNVPDVKNMNLEFEPAVNWKGFIEI